MKIKEEITTMFFTCFYLFILVSCESHEQKADDAFDIVKAEKLRIKDTIVIENKIPETSTKVFSVKEIESDWSKFKNEIEKKIFLNENIIKEIKSNPNVNAKLLKKVTSLEQDNNELRKKMDQYKEEVEVMWENFKTEINHSVNDIGIELKDITVNTK